MGRHQRVIGACAGGLRCHGIGGRVGPRIDLFEVCSAFTRVVACTLALPPNRGSLTRTPA